MVVTGVIVALPFAFRRRYLGWVVESRPQHQFRKLEVFQQNAAWPHLAKVGFFPLALFLDPAPWQK